MNFLRKILPYQSRPVAFTVNSSSSAFTLIELSIVLVIIGLIVGGVLVGQDLIKASRVRATIAQIERYNAATNTFRGKYGYLPGDIPDPGASNFGFKARGAYAGEGDGNGVMEGVLSNAAGQNSGVQEGPGENLTFWVDLSTAKLIDGGFTTADLTTLLTPNSATGVTDSTSPPLSSYLPAAKLGGNLRVYVTSLSGINYFGISGVTSILFGQQLISTPNIPVNEAYLIDQKMDDGLPSTGSVTARYLSSSYFGIWGAPFTATPPIATTCYGTAAQVYSVTVNGGAGPNCALAFRFQ